MIRLFSFVAVLSLANLGCATAAQMARPTYEHWCFDIDGVPSVKDLESAGAQGWEMVSTTFRPPVVQNGSSVGGGATYVCFKRLK
jgi:hypothetical protein